MCFTFLTSPASFPSQYGLGPRENANCQREVKLQLKGRNTLKTLQVRKASSWSTGSVVSPPYRTADTSRGHTAQGLNGVDGIFGIEFSNDVKFVDTRNDYREHNLL